MQTKLYVSTSNNPWFNLAFEEYLVNEVKENEIFFYLWQNAHTVVIGKHQNPWREVLVSDLEQDSGKVARRLSGGGAVYHDLGNLNFTFVMAKKHENLEKQLKVILDAVNELGIKAAFSGRNDLVVNEKKFSGNAFYYGKNTYYHHGTLLVDVDLDNLGKYLNVSSKKLNAKGVKSVKSRVMNLKELNPNLTIDLMKNALLTSFQREYGASDVIYKITEKDAPEKAIERFEHYASWEWRYGKTPDFDVSYEEKFDWGEIVLNFKLKDALIQDLKVFSDAMNTEIAETMSSALIGCKFDNESLSKAIETMVFQNPDSKEFKDIFEWLKSLSL